MTSLNDYLESKPGLTSSLHALMDLEQEYPSIYMDVVTVVDDQIKHYHDIQQLKRNPAFKKYIASLFSKHSADSAIIDELHDIIMEDK